MEIYGETLGDSQVEVRFLVLVTQIHHFLTWKPRFDPTLHTICLYLFIREVIENMAFFHSSFFGSSMKAREDNDLLLWLHHWKSDLGNDDNFQRTVFKRDDAFRDCQQEKTKTSWKTFKVKSFPLRSAAIFRIFESRNNNKQFCRTNRPQFGVFPQLSSHPHLFHVQDRRRKFRARRVAVGQQKHTCIYDI